MKINRRTLLLGTFVPAAKAEQKPVGWFLELEMKDGNVKRHFYPAAEYEEEYVRKNIFREGEPNYPWVNKKTLTPLFS